MAGVLHRRRHLFGAAIVTARSVWPQVEIRADPAHEASATRRVFFLLATETATPESHRVLDSPVIARAVRLAGESVARNLAVRDPVVFTDDFAPIDRMLGDR